MNQTLTLTCSDYYQNVLQPISEDAPCGEYLDYDPAFIMLQSRLQPKLGAEYGDFYEAAEPVNWTDIERECLALIQKSKDIRLIIILMRCRLRKVGLIALSEGTEALRALLQIWPDDLHPQLLDEGEFAPMLRANAFAELEDINGLLADFRNQSLPKASGLQITVKEFEKAHQVPREEGALSDAAIAALVSEWHISAQEGISPLTQAYQFVLDIKHSLAAMLNHEAPELAVLLGILKLFTSELSDQPASTAALPADPAHHEVVEETLYTIPQMDSPAMVEPTNFAPLSTTQAVIVTPRQSVNSRSDALHQLKEIRSWFTVAEPGSPVVQVLQYAEDSIGKSFTELLKMYPPEIVAILSQEKE